MLVNAIKSLIGRKNDSVAAGDAACGCSGVGGKFGYSGVEFVTMCYDPLYFSFVSCNGYYVAGSL